MVQGVEAVVQCGSDFQVFRVEEIKDYEEVQDY
jgi:hypothetical protein